MLEYYLDRMKTLQPVRSQLQSGADRERPDVEGRRWSGRRRTALDRLDRNRHEGLPATPVELELQRPVPHNYTVVKWPPAFKSVGFGEDEYAQILKSTLEMEDLIARYSAIMDKYGPEKKVALVVDEWDGWYAPLPGSYQHGDSTLPRVDAMAAKSRDGKLWVEITNVDPNQAVEVELSVSGISAKSASGETLTAPKVDSVNTFEVPNTVVPKPISARAHGGKLILQLEPKSVIVVPVEQ